MFVFSERNLAKIEQLKTRYPSRNALVLPLLWLVQEQERVITMDAIDSVAVITEVAPMDVYRVATFYTMFNLEPVGTYHIQVCKTLSCKLCNQAAVLEQLKLRLGIEVGETTNDGRFTLSLVECLGSCGSAPVMQVNETYYENLTADRIDEIIKELS